jgi:hypothetical protein
VLVPRVIIPLPEAIEFIVRTEKKEAEQGGISYADRRLERNNQILRYFRQLDPARCPEKASTQTWMHIPTAHRDVFFEWLRSSRGQARKCYVAIHSRTSDEDRNYGLLEYLEGWRKEIGAQVGESVIFDRAYDPPKDFTAAYVAKSCEPWNEEIAKWAAEKMDKLIKAAEPLINDYYSHTPNKHSELPTP